MANFIVKILFTGFCTASISLGCFAQAKYPEKPIKMIVTWSAGGPVDVGARAVANALSQSLKQPVLVDNKPGASGMIGTEAGAKSPADGYTIVVGNADTFAMNPNLYPNIRYDALKGFDSIAPLGTLPLVLALRSDFGGSSGTDLIRLAKAQPGKLTYGSWGIGSLGHVGVVMLEQIANIDLLHVPYQGGAPAQAALMGNQIDMLMTQVPFAENQQKIGKMKILGLTSAKRSAIYPNVPTLAEQGFPGYAAEQWVGFFVPTGTPQTVREVLTREINAYLKSPTGASQLKEIGFDASGGSAADLTAIVANSYERWGKLIRDRKIVVQ